KVIWPSRGFLSLATRSPQALYHSVCFIIHLERSRRDGNRRNPVERLGSAPGRTCLAGVKVFEQHSGQVKEPILASRPDNGTSDALQAPARRDLVFPEDVSLVMAAADVARCAVRSPSHVPGPSAISDCGPGAFLRRLPFRAGRSFRDRTARRFP